MPHEPDMKSNPGKAKIVKTGHTASNRFGTNPDSRVKGKVTSRDLGIK